LESIACLKSRAKSFIEMNCKMARFPRTGPEVMDLAILRIALAQAMVLTAKSGK
jgi:hypothetical protein